MPVACRFELLQVCAKPEGHLNASRTVGCSNRTQLVGVYQPLRSFRRTTGRYVLTNTVPFYEAWGFSLVDTNCLDGRSPSRTCMGDSFDVPALP